MSSAGKLLKHQKGNVGIIFAIALIPMILAVGAAVDWVRINQVRAVLQNAVDAAALGGGASGKTTDAEVEAIAHSYLANANFAEVVDNVKVVTLKSDTANGKLSVKITGDMKTSFMSLAGINWISIGAESEVARAGGSAPLEVALALDTTGSMMGSKITALKSAANSLVDTLMVAGADTKVGVVPFAEYVNVGTDKAGEPWLSMPSGTSAWDEYTYPDKTGCTTVTWPSVCYADGLPYACTTTNETCTSYGDPVIIHHVSTPSWYGCVGSREGDDAKTIANATAKPYPALAYTWCTSALTDLTKTKATVTGAIDALSANGNTYIPSGLLWGWNLLDPSVPFTSGMSYGALAAKSGKKALVLMTDGENTLVQNTWSGGGTHEPCGGGYGSCDPANAMTATLCENIKAQGIVVYTVLFDVTNPDLEAMLRTCASDSSKSFVADDAAALLAAFKSIGKSLSALRLTK